MEDLKEKEIDELDTYKGKWKILILSNKGEFLSPESYSCQASTEDAIKRLRRSHKQSMLRQCGGLRDIITKAYFPIPIGDS